MIAIEVLAAAVLLFSLFGIVISPKFLGNRARLKCVLIALVACGALIAVSDPSRHTPPLMHRERFLPATAYRGRSNAGIYGIMASAGVATATKSSFSSRMQADAAETRARMFGDLTKEQVAEMRKSFGDRAAVKYGLGTVPTIDAYTEVIKAGIPIGKGIASAVTEQILMSAAGLDAMALFAVNSNSRRRWSRASFCRAAAMSVSDVPRLNSTAWPMVGTLTNGSPAVSER